jgi:putative ABC transport system permease protein
MVDDLRFAVRRLRHSPGFTVVALLTLTLAIGVNVSVLSIADAVLFRPLPYEDPDRVFVLRMIDKQTGQRYTRIAGDLMEAINAHHATVSPVAMADTGPRIVVEGPAGAEVVPSVGVTANYFQLLGVRPALGRIFHEQDASGSQRPAMLSYGAWRTRFGGDESIVGRALPIGAVTFDIIGVLPANFVFPSGFARGSEVVTVLPPTALNDGAFHPIVRLDPGVTIARAQAEMDALIVPRTRRPARNGDVSIALDDVRSVIYPVARSVMVLLVAAAALVLIIGCANLANMLVTRTTRQERESGVRAALGAGSLRLVRPVVFECLILGVSGTVLALLAGWATFGVLLPHVPRLAYGGAPVGVDGRVALVALGMGLLAGLCFAIVPAWRSAHVDPQVLLHSRHRVSKRGWLKHPLIALQVTASIVLVFGAVITTRAFLSILNVPLGFEPSHVVVISVWPPDKGTRLQDFYMRALESLIARPDVLAAGAAGSMPLDGTAPDQGMALPDGTPGPVGLVHVLPGYFEAAGIHLVRGRLLDSNDVRANSGAALLSQAAAAAAFPGTDPLGRAFTNTRGRTFTVVGIVSDVLKSHGSTAGDRPPGYIIPGTDARVLTLVVRMRPGVRGNDVLVDLRRQIAPMAPGTPVVAVWWSEQISGLAAYRNPRFQTIVLAAFGLLAMGLMGIGVYAVVSFLVASRTREIGIRIAIGAEPRAVINNMARLALTPVLLGAIGGVLATRWMAKLAEAQLFKVEADDPVTLVAASITVVIAAGVAAYVPARHAARVDPVIALRAD